MLPGIIGSATVLAAIAAVLFASAGRWDVPMFWAYLGVWAVPALIGPVVMDPGLIKERLHPGPGAQDRGRTIAFVPLWLGQFVVAGLDVGRLHWSDTVPLPVQIVGLLATAAARRSRSGRRRSIASSRR